MQLFGSDAQLDAAGNITNEATASRLPPTTFEWQGAEDWRNPTYMQFSNLAPRISGNRVFLSRKYGHVITGDWNGDGKTDMLYLYPDSDSQYSWVALANGDGTLTFGNWIAVQALQLSHISRNMTKIILNIVIDIQHG